MNVVLTNLPDVLVIEPQVFCDDRGFFYESYNAREFAKATGVDAAFVQDNHSRSSKNVLRGLHYQIEQPQGKLVRVTEGEIFDVAVDLRRSSSTFGQWTGNTLSAANKRMLWIPPGFAHGFQVLSNHADVIYKTTTYWNPAFERCILWSDPQLNIDWAVQGVPLLSAKDREGVLFMAAGVFL